MNTIQYHKLECGLQIVTERIRGVRTAAIHWGLRAGVATNTHDGDGVLLAEMVQRGVKGLTAKQHNDALDTLGVKRHVACGVEFFQVSGVMLGSRIVEAIPLLTGYMLYPMLPEKDLPACKSLCLQSIQSLADNPAHQTSVALNTFHHPPPFNRTTYGDQACIESASIERLKQVHEEAFVPEGSILVVAGDIEHQQIVDTIECATQGWTGKLIPLQTTAQPDRGIHWIEQDSSQVHICIALDGPNASDDKSILESIAISVFGGATSGRLFTEVRQRRSLCYSVSAQYAASRDRSVVRISAGTTPQHGDETVNVCLEQLQELRKGITEAEFKRAIQRMKSATVMRGESTAARSSAIWADQFALGYARTLKERLQEIDSVKIKAVNAWLAERDYGQLTVVTLGPQSIAINDQLIHAT